MQFAVTLMALSLLLPLPNIETVLRVCLSKKVLDGTEKRSFPKLNWLKKEQNEKQNGLRMF
jgi:hypothetical protein